MNQTFSLARFARLNRWFWATKGRTYLLGAGALFVLIVLILSQVLASDGTTEQLMLSQISLNQSISPGHLVYFNFIVLILAASLGSDVYSSLYRQESAIAYLMIPASRAEKFWLGVLYSMVAVILFSVVYWGYEAIAFRMANARFPASQTDRYIPTLLYYATPPQAGILLMFTYAIFISLAAAWLGSFFFRRGVFVRNVGFSIMCALGLFLVYHWIVGLQFSGYTVGQTGPFLAVVVHDKSRYESIAPPVWLTYMAYIGTLVAIWVIARIRFNELER